MSPHSQSIAGRVAVGGKAIYGAPLGILMLEAQFPRIPGRHGQRHHLAVSGPVSRGARGQPRTGGAERRRRAAADFLDAAAELVAHGAEAITTNCGFLSLFQRELAAHVRVPVATSALMQVPWVQATLPPGSASA